MKDINKEKRPVYVIGHRNPDTDAICSAIVYADYKRRLTGGSYVAMRCGNVNNETRYVLDRFGAEAPEYIEDVRIQVRDMEIKTVAGISADTSVKNAWNIMKDKDVVTLCITDRGKLKGLITTSILLEAYMDVSDTTLLARSGASFGNIIDAIDGELIYGDASDTVDEGKVVVTVGSIKTIKHMVNKGDIAIVGDTLNTQRASIEDGAGCIIICGGAGAGEEILELAGKHGCRVITTDHSAFTVARLIYLSIPVSYCMKRHNLVTFQLDDYIEDVRPVMAETRHRYFPVLDHHGRYMGMVSRRNFIGSRKKQIIMVDHNEKSQAVFGVEDAELLEIVDHHRLGNMPTVSPVFFRNMPLGCTSTILYKMHIESGLEITPLMAGLMMSAIISDTLLFRSPTCTDDDIDAVNHLSRIAGVDPQELAKEMFRAGSDLGTRTPEEILHLDYKKFDIGDYRVGIGQVSSMDYDSLIMAESRILPVLQQLCEKDGTDMVFLLMTNIMEESSVVLFAGNGAADVIHRAYGAEQLLEGEAVLMGVVSRKKQFLPDITEAITS